MKRFSFILLFFCSILISKAQFQDDFSDGNFTSNPTWIGNTDSFEITTEILQLNAPANTQESYISTASEGAIDGFWEFYVELDFNPSSGNKALIYLISDNSNLKEDLNGYYVSIGNTTDEVSLYKQSGDTQTEIIDGTDDLVDVSFVKVNVRVTRDNIGNWELFADTSAAQNNFVSQGVSDDDSYLSSNFFGVLCDYTSTRSDKFFFDNFEVTTTAFTDNFSPQLVDNEIVGLNSVTLEFNEPLSIATAEDISNFSMDNGIGNPVLASYDALDNSIDLDFDNSFAGNTNYSVSISNISDTSANILDTTFTFIISDLYQFQAALINEILPDETPSFGLPEAEFIELKNNTNDTLFTADWILADASDSTNLSADTILPNEFLILCKTTAEESYDSIGDALGVSSFVSLNKTEDQLYIYDKYGTPIDSLHYFDDWYRNISTLDGELKVDGGFSLERIDLQNPCGDFFNWYPSEAEIGGSPGIENTVFQSVIPIEFPNLNFAMVLNDTTILVEFDNNIIPPATSDFELTTVTYFDLDIGIVQMAQNITLFNETTLQITFENNFLLSQLYTLEIVGLTDCAGNSIGVFTEDFFREEPLEDGDLIINEILFNPNTGGADFVEIYNKSSKVVSLNGLKINEYDSDEEDTIIDFVELNINTLMPPNTFFVFTEDKEYIEQNYFVATPEYLFEINLPNYPDDEGIVGLIYNDSIELDKLNYKDDWHFDLLDSDDGVSLERTSYEQPTQTNDNWHSAAKSEGFTTPTKENSQLTDLGILENSIDVIPEVFTPDQDGIDDFTIINFNFDKPGFTAAVSIFDAVGREVKTITQNELLGSTGTWKWDGTNNNFEKAKVGIYIVYVEVFDASGKVERIKKKVVLGARL